MANHQVTCIVKPNVLSSHEHITHIGNGAEHWNITREDAIRRIESKADAFYVKDPISGKTSWIAVVRETGKVPYLRTHADGDWNNNLLSLGQCFA